MKSIGLGLGLLIWGLVGMLVGWASGHFGILGVAPDPPLAAPYLNYVGVLFACASLGVYANITSEVSSNDRDRGVPGATGHSERDVDWVGNSPRSPSLIFGGESPRGNARPGFSPFNSSRPGMNDTGNPSPFGRANSSGSLSNQGTPLPGSPLGRDSASTPPGERAPLLFAGGESPHGSSTPRSVPSSPESDEAGTPRWVRKAQEQTGGKFTFGFLLASVAGIFYGTNFNPPQRLIDEATLYGKEEHSKDALDYVFSHFCGIFFSTLLYFIVYCAVKQSRGRKPQLPPCVLPAFMSGLMWGIAQICWFVANERLSFSVSFPIITSVPGLIGALWGVLVFGEIKGRDNIVLLIASGVMRIVAVGLIAASKEGV